MTTPEVRTMEASAVFESEEDGALVEACLAGNRDAFSVLVSRHQRHVYRLCYRFVGNHEDASDLAQEVFLRAFRALAAFKREAAFGTWLYRIAVNVCLTKVGSRLPPTEPLDDAPTPRAAGAPADEELLRAERAAQVRRAIAQLPKRQRATLILHVYHDLSHVEISRILGNTVGGVKANFFHAMKNLRRLLGGGPR